MATVEFSAERERSERLYTGFIDRWIYVIMAALFVVTALTGFIPDSIGKLAAVEAGSRPPLPPVLHVHAVLMGSWLLLLLAQTTLMATGRPALHRQLGLAAMVLAPAMVITGSILAPTIYWQNWELYQIAPPEAAEAMKQGLIIQGNFVSQQLRDGSMFCLLIGLGLYFRRHDPQTHKRLMVLGTAILLPAAIGRIPWLPQTAPASPISFEFYVLLLILPMFMWDAIRQRKVHEAYPIFLAVYLPIAAANVIVWDTPWWRAFVQDLMGVSF